VLKLNSDYNDHHLPKNEIGLADKGNLKLINIGTELILCLVTVVDDQSGKKKDLHLMPQEVKINLRLVNDLENLLVSGNRSNFK